MKTFYRLQSSKDGNNWKDETPTVDDPDEIREVSSNLASIFKREAPKGGIRVVKTQEEYIYVHA